MGTTGPSRYSTATARGGDDREAMREWRWRSYTDHLRDMGYDLDGGGSAGGHLLSLRGQPGQKDDTGSLPPVR